MFRSATAVSAILLSTVLLSSGQGLHQALIPVRAALDGFSSLSISVLASVYFAGYLIGCFGAPLVIRRVGYTRTFAVTAALLGALALSHSLLTGPFYWIVLRGFIGFSFASIDVVMESWLVARVDASSRGRVLSLYRMLDLFAIGLGQYLIATASPTDFTLFAVVTILICLAVLPVGLSVAPTPEPPSRVSVRLRHVMKLSPVATLAVIVHGVSSGIYWAEGPILANRVSTDPQYLGLALAATLLGAAAFQLPIGWASDRFERRKLIAIGALAAGLAALTLAITTQFMADLLIPAFFIYGVASFNLYPLAVCQAQDRSTSEDVVEIGAALLVFFGLGATFGPLAIPLVTQWLPITGAFVLNACLFGLLTLFVLYRIRTEKPVPEDELVEHVDIPTTTPVVLAIDPRAETEEEYDAPTPPEEAEAPVPQSG